jgi:signal transduction histidine kinase
VKHARAATLRIQVGCSRDALTLAISDDGVGFDPSGSFPGHLGHRSMQERTARLSGTLVIESAPGQGTRIRATLPLDGGRRG